VGNNMTENSSLGVERIGIGCERASTHSQSQASDRPVKTAADGTSSPFATATFHFAKRREADSKKSTRRGKPTQIAAC
jgi:hypothetical protein